MQKLITFGEVMMRLSPPGFQRFSQAESLEVVYGGGEANVAVAVAQLGVTTSHVTCFPENDLGYSAAASLKKWGVGTEYIVYKGNRLGQYFLEKGSSLRASKVVYDRDNSAFAQLSPELFNWKEILKGASWFHWTGITPAVSHNAAVACLQAIRAAKELGLTVSGDITYRKNLWQYGKTVQQVMPELVEGSDLVICGESEAEEIFGIQSKENIKDPFETLGRGLIKRFPNLKKVISTKRETINASHNKLGGIMWNGEQLIQTKSYDIEPIIDRIGGGDAFMAGFIFSALKGRDDKNALEFATAASVLKHTIQGDALLVTEKEIEQLIQGNAVGRLVR